jgi:hypothetical protein
VLINDRLLLDESFASAADANTFFADLWFDLGAMPTDRDLLQFEIHSTMLLNQPSAGYGLGFAFGNGTVPSVDDGPMLSAVPEPGSASLAALTLVLCGLRRRRLPGEAKLVS